MNGNERREQIVKLLANSEKAVTGAELSKSYGVSRQVIVQDIAILRAQGESVLATPQGYIMIETKTNKILKTIVSEHHTMEELRKELYIIVDFGGKVLDVIVEHPIYGEIKANLMISSRIEADELVSKLENNKATPLSALTQGLHLHTLEVDSEDLYQKIVAALLELNKINK